MFKLCFSGPHAMGPAGYADAARELDARVNDFLGDNPGRRVVAPGNLYFHIPGGDTFTLFLPVFLEPSDGG